MVKTPGDGDGVIGVLSVRGGVRRRGNQRVKATAEGGSELRAFAAFPEWPGNVPRAHVVANNHLEFRFLVEEVAPWMLHIHTQGKTFIHIKINL